MRISIAVNRQMEHRSAGGAVMVPVAKSDT